MDIEKLRRDIEALQAYNADKDEVIKDLREELRDLRDELRDLRDEHQETRRALKQALDQLE